MTNHELLMELSEEQQEVIAGGMSISGIDIPSGVSLLFNQKNSTSFDAASFVAINNTASGPLGSVSGGQNAASVTSTKADQHTLIAALS